MTPVTEPVHRTPIDGWADAWATHGSTVLSAAAALHMDVDEALRRVVAAMADPTAPFDPLEHFGALAERRTNRWLTSPGEQTPMEFEVEGELLTTWRATDFGTTVQAARTARQAGVLTRPVASVPE